MRRSYIQRAFLFVYKLVASSGLLSASWGRTLFERAYLLYKYKLEARALSQLEYFVAPGSIVVDVGANIGSFTMQFAQWTGPLGLVYAIEPEPFNFSRLTQNLSKSGLAERVCAVRALVAERHGDYFLELNPHHPGDHRLSTSETGIQVTGTTVDELLARHQDAQVSVIKIDVQGAELRVLMGATETLRRHRPVFLIEIDPKALGRYGSSARAVLDFFAGHMYRPHAVDGRNLTPALDTQQALGMLHDRSYMDFLFLPEECGRPATRTASP